MHRSNAVIDRAVCFLGRFLPKLGGAMCSAFFSGGSLAAQWIEPYHIFGQAALVKDFSQPSSLRTVLERSLRPPIILIEYP